MCTGQSDGTAGEAEQHAPEPSMKDFVMEKSSWGYLKGMKFQASMMDETLRQEQQRASEKARADGEYDYISDYMNVDAYSRDIEGESNFKNVEIVVRGDSTNTILENSVADKFISKWENQFNGSVYFSKSGDAISLSKAKEIYNKQ